MVTNHKPTGKAMSMPAGLCLGACVSVGITLLSALILAKLLDAQTIQWEQSGYGIMIFLLLASFSGAAFARAKIKRQKMLVCLLSGAIYFGILLSATALFFGGQYEAVGVTALLILGGCVPAGMLGAGKGGGAVHKRSRAHR